jgi:excisionase family DNA binding protein
MTERLITVSDAAAQLGVTKKTLQVWDREGKLSALRTAGGHRRYRQSDIERLQGIERETIDRNQVAVYCRVSSQDQKQKGDLDRQKARLLEHCVAKEYKVAAILFDVCSGMKAKRPKLKQLFKLVSERKINRVVIEYKDRLTRFCFEVFEAFFNSHGVEIECVEEVFPKSFEGELVEDMLSLLSSFSSKIYGKRSAENRRKKKEAEQK